MDGKNWERTFEGSLSLLFEGCHKLATVVSHIPAHALFEVNNNVFGNISEDCVLYVPKGAATTYKNTHGWAGFSRIVEM